MRWLVARRPRADHGWARARRLGVGGSRLTGDEHTGLRPVAVGIGVILAAVAIAAAVLARPARVDDGSAAAVEASVRNHGAVGDGLADDGDAILRDRDAAGPGGRVVFPAGTYRFSRPLKLSLPRQEWSL